MSMNALSQLGVTPFNGYGDMSGQKQPEKPQSGIMNVLSKVFEYGAPEAFEQGRQKKHQNALASALQSRDFGGAADAAFASGNINGGLDLLDYNRSAQSAQSEAGQAEKVRKLQGMAVFAQNMRQIPEAERGRWAMDNWQMLEPIVGKDFMTYWQESGGDVSDASLDEDLLAIQTALGQGPTQAEEYTLAPGAQRFRGGEMIADNAKAAPGPEYKQVTTADGIYEYIPGQPGSERKIGDAPVKSPLVSVNTGDQGQRMGKVPEGMSVVPDPSHPSGFRFEPISGSAQEKENITLNSKAYQALQANNEQFDAIMTNIDAADELIGGFTAGAGSYLEGIRGTPAKNLSARLETVKANIGFDKLNEMRQTSPTGGALGQVTERELNFLQSVRGSLDSGQSPQQLRETLLEVKASLERLQEVREIAFKIEQQNAGQGQIAPTEGVSNGDLPPGFEIVQ